MQSDMLIRGSVFDSVSDHPFDGYVSVKGGRIEAVGKGDGAGHIDAATKVFDAEGYTVMAGFHDSHTHLLMSGMFAHYPNLSDCASEEACVEKLKALARTCDPWVIGFGWYHIFWNIKHMPTFESLDKAFPGIPVMLLNAEAHGIWVNSKALEVAGIDSSTPDPSGGEILRLPDGRPSGVLLESACGLVTKYAYDFDEGREKELIAVFMKQAASYGITSVNDVMPYFHGNMGHIPVYSAIDHAGALNVRIHAAPDLFGDLDEVVRMRDEYSSDRLRIDQVKQFIDGVSTTHTALMLEPYADDFRNNGVGLFPLDDIRKAVLEAHRRKLSVKLHACGDASARFALDCYENAIRKYGGDGRRHAIEHCELINGSDIPRFGELGVLPSVQPEHLALTQTFRENPYLVTMGEARADMVWPLKSLLRSAGHIAIGSDCPVVDNNPFLEIYRAITRVHNDGEPKGGWNPAEKLTLAETLKAYTLGSAWGVQRESDLGSLEAGKFADIIVVDRNLFESSPIMIKSARVSLTIMDGKVVYKR